MAGHGRRDEAWLDSLSGTGGGSRWGGEGRGQRGVLCFTAGGTRTMGDHTSGDSTPTGQDHGDVGLEPNARAPLNLHDQCTEAARWSGRCSAAYRGSAEQCDPFRSLHTLLFPPSTLTWIACPLLMTCTLVPSERMEPRSKMERDEETIRGRPAWEEEVTGTRACCMGGGVKRAPCVS